jgi:membrane protein
MPGCFHQRLPAPLRVPWRAAAGFIVNNGSTRAGYIAFASLFAVFPFLICLTSLAGLAGRPEMIDGIVALAFETLPAEVVKTLAPVVAEVLTERRSHLFTIGMIATLWASSSGIEALRAGLNLAYGVTEPRPIWHRRLQGLLFVVMGALVTLIATAAILIGPTVWRYISDTFHLPAVWEGAYAAARYGVAPVTILLAIAILYRWLPKPGPSRLVLPGAVLATAAWLTLASLFSLYFERSTHYTVTYGSLGGVVVTLLFFYLSAAIFVFGAEFNAALGQILS